MGISQNPKKKRTDNAPAKAKVINRPLAERPSALAAENKALKTKYQSLAEKYKNLQRQNTELAKENRHLLDRAAGLLLALRHLQEQEEAWNRKDGDFFNRIMPILQTLHGALAADDQDRAEKVLGELREQIQSSRGMLHKDKQLHSREWTGAHLALRDIDNALAGFKKYREESEKNVLYQNLLFPILCILAAGSLKQEEIDTVLLAEGLKALYYDQLPPEDAKNRSSFIETNEETQTPGIFCARKDTGCELFGDHQGKVIRKRAGEKSWTKEI